MGGNLEPLEWREGLQVHGNADAGLQLWGPLNKVGLVAEPAAVELVSQFLFSRRRELLEISVLG